MNLVEKACFEIEGFAAFYEKLRRKIKIHSLSQSTLKSYGRALAHIGLRFHLVPITLSQEQVELYLYELKSKEPVPSETMFKFTIFSLRFAFRMEGIQEPELKLPSIRKKRKLPVVLSKEEITSMMNTPCSLRHRVMIAVLYACGLRCSELRNLKTEHLDFSRKEILIRNGKGGKDRYLPMGEKLEAILLQYLHIESPSDYLFRGRRPFYSTQRFFATINKQYGNRSIQWIVQRAAKQAGISKTLSVHTLRHTYATHLLEEGVNLFTIQSLLGHASIETTMIYLHIARISNNMRSSPLDKLPGLRVIGWIQGNLNFE
jgi:site-specific recombinase XerD